jgi:thioredoxin 1
LAALAYYGDRAANRPSKERLVKKLLPLLAVASLCTLAQAGGPAPYDERADAGADIQHAIAAAKADHRSVLLLFGANWCGDCRALDLALHGRSGQLIEQRYVVVKIDVGNFDKNLYLAKRYGNPIVNGIPALVVLDADNQVVYSTRQGELANAGQMSEQSIYEFLKQKIANRS